MMLGAARCPGGPHPMCGAGICPGASLELRPDPLLRVPTSFGTPGGSSVRSPMAGAPVRRRAAVTQPARRRSSLSPPLSCCTTFLHLLPFNVLIKRLIREVIHEKDGYLDKAQKLVAVLSPQISILHERERQKRHIFVPLSFHHCSSKDQSLQKINLKENF